MEHDLQNNGEGSSPDFGDALAMSFSVTAHPKPELELIFVPGVAPPNSADRSRRR